MASDETSRPDDPPGDLDDDAFDDGVWDADFAESLIDPSAANLFTAEIENVNASDWDVDTALIWGDDGGDDAVDGGETLGLDLPF
jgi:hypothetical protein